MGCKRRTRRHSKRRGHSRQTVIVPKSRPNGHPKGFSKLTRCQNRRQAVYGHAITYSPSYQKAHHNTVNVKLGRGGQSKPMPMFKAERQWLRQNWGIESRKEPQKL